MKLVKLTDRIMYGGIAFVIIIAVVGLLTENNSLMLVGAMGFLGAVIVLMTFVAIQARKKIESLGLNWEKEIFESEVKF